MGAQIAVIGAGIVGLACAHALLADGHRITLIDRDPEGDKASFGNAAGIGVTEVVPISSPHALLNAPRWMLDPLGPLALRAAHLPAMLPWLWRFARVARPAETRRIAAALAALMAPTYDDLVPLLAAYGLEDELRRVGALTVYRSDAAYRADAAGWALKRAHGIVAEELSGAAARKMEPALGPAVTRAVFAPDWAQVGDPKRIADTLRHGLLARGVTLRRDAVQAVERSGDGARVVGAAGPHAPVERVVVAAGAWSGRIATTLGDRVLLESERGYNMTLAAPGIALTREIIFAEEHFVASPITGGLRIGGAAEFGGLDAAPNMARADRLMRLAGRYLPGLEGARGVPWAGHRPSTPDSLPVIGPSPRNPAVIYAFGHGHLGLTQAATTGRVVADLVAQRAPGLDLAPFAITRF